MTKPMRAAIAVPNPCAATPSITADGRHVKVCTSCEAVWEDGRIDADVIADRVLP